MSRGGKSLVQSEGELSFLRSGKGRVKKKVRGKEKRGSLDS